MKTVAYHSAAKAVSSARARCPIELFTPTEERKLKMPDMLAAAAQGCAALAFCGLVHWAILQ